MDQQLFKSSGTEKAEEYSCYNEMKDHGEEV